MAGIKLTMDRRAKLRGLAIKLVSCPAEEAALEEAYIIAEPLVRFIVLDKYPIKDMKILKKYEKAKIDNCIRLNLAAGGVEQFEFKSGTGPLVAMRTYQGAIYQADSVTSDAVAIWVLAKGALTKAKRAKLDDYYALIDSARSLDQVSEIWPEADILRPLMESRSLITMNDEIVVRIKADIESRKKDS